MKIKPKKLNLDEIWKLYLLLKPSIDNRESEKIIFDEILTIIDLASPQSLLAAINILYDNKVKFTTPLEFNELFTKGIVESGFLVFCEIIRGLNGSSR